VQTIDKKMGQGLLLHRVLCGACRFVVLVAGTVIYGKGDEAELAEEIAHVTDEAALTNTEETAPSSALDVPASTAIPSLAGSMPIAMDTSVGSFKATMQLNAHSGSLSRSLARYRVISPRMMGP
jgi:uncharacterized heparinase superfamily protein